MTVVMREGWAEAANGTIGECSRRATPVHYHGREQWWQVDHDNGTRRCYFDDGVFGNNNDQEHTPWNIVRIHDIDPRKVEPEVVEETGPEQPTEKAVESLAILITRRLPEFGLSFNAESDYFTICGPEMDVVAIPRAAISRVIEVMQLLQRQVAEQEGLG